MGARRRPAHAVVLAGLALLPALLPVPAAATAASAAAASASAVSGLSASGFSGTLAQAVAVLPQAQVQAPGYDRSLFRHWTDADRDCQDTRAEVLQAETTTPVRFTTARRCTVATGRWTSSYDGRTWTAASDVDVDHVVALAEAWRSGADRWTSARRHAYANDLADPRSLAAVTDEVNQSKGDRDPAAWLPALDRCRYVADWTAVKLRWGLSADAAERRVLEGHAASCPAATVTVARA